MTVTKHENGRSLLPRCDLGRRRWLRIRCDGRLLPELLNLLRQPSLILVDMLNKENRSADAKTLLAELKQKFPRRTDVAMNVALNSIEDHPELARKEIDEILKAEPDNALAHTLLGELQYYSGDYKAAEAT